PLNHKQEAQYAKTGLTHNVIMIANLMYGEKVITNDMQNELLEPAADNIVCAFYWLLTAAEGDPYAAQAWYQPNEERLPVVKAFQRWCAESCEKDEKIWRERRKTMARQAPKADIFAAENRADKEETFDDSLTTGKLTYEPELHQPAPTVEEKISPAESLADTPPAAAVSSPATAPRINPQTGKNTSFVRPIDHYLLLPLYEWGVADWHLDVIRPFIKKHRVTVGFSVREAALAKKVTVVGNAQSFPEDLLEKLRATGCDVERIQGDGGSIASQLATR
ncbi:MAG: hypothetical protein AAGU05_09340, partial [Anaerolineaceae bacterium]